MGRNYSDSVLENMVFDISNDALSFIKKELTAYGGRPRGDWPILLTEADKHQLCRKLYQDIVYRMIDDDWNVK